MDDIKLHFSFFHSWKDSIPKPWSGTWDDFKKHPTVQHTPLNPGHDKRNTGAFSPVEYFAGATRGKSNVKAVYALGLDYDSITDEGLLELNKALAGYKAWVYTSANHPNQDDTSRIRVLLPLAKPVPGAQWTKFWESIVGMFPAGLDQSCKDASRLFGTPCAFDIDSAFQRWFDGPKFLDSTGSLGSSLLPLPPNESVTPSRKLQYSQAINPKDLSRLAKGSPKDPEKQVLKNWVHQLSQGLPYADPETRHDARLRLTAYLESKFPSTTLESIADLFFASHNQMYGPEKLDEVRTEVMNGLKGARKFREEKQAQREEQAKKKADYRTRRVSATGPYNDDDVEGFAARLGVSTEEFTLLWILRHLNTYYFFTPEGYRGPYPAAMLLDAARDLLAPAVESDQRFVVIDVPSDNGAKPKTPGDLFRDYGSIVDRVVFSNHEDTELILNGEATLRLRKARLKPVEPFFDEKIDLWLRELAGDAYTELMRWLILSRDLSSPISALYVHGQPGAGKGTLAECIASMWDSQPIPATVATSKNNIKLLGNPVIFADESLPSAWLGQLGLERFRSDVSSTRWMLEEKFMPVVPLESSCRIILASNNDHLFHVGRDLTPDDRDAIRQRVFDVEIPADSKAAELISDWWQFNPERRQDMIDSFAAHVEAFAQQNPELAVKIARFGVLSKQAAVHNALMFNDPSNNAVADWILGVLFDPVEWERHTAGTPKQFCLLKEGGKLLIQAKAMDGREIWEAYTQVKRPLSSRKLSLSLAVWAPTRVRKTRGYYRAVDLDLLGEYAEYTERGDKQSVIERFEEFSEGPETIAPLKGIG